MNIPAVVAFAISRSRTKLNAQSNGRLSDVEWAIVMLVIVLTSAWPLMYVIYVLLPKLLH